MWRGDYTHGLHKGSAQLLGHPGVTPLYACGRWALPSEVGPASFFNAAGAGAGAEANVDFKLQALTFTFEGREETIPVYVFFTSKAVAKDQELLWNYRLNGDLRGNGGHTGSHESVHEAGFLVTTQVMGIMQGADNLHTRLHLPQGHSAQNLW